ncbi:hypothetical protein TNIN_25741 [Trichonephila inaurata madagascariensis]|uniref:E3 ubiquitin-protein ligase Topors n=1 Tax=Trichonephila inaurata madagascariensis TaxID=2747483 RepID=A0A8X6XI32_9ARAC|nr:hypothetical protein TNIN_332581 [Trichonephila inaurata madagascariensis]GFY74855.1 hypothetical protein TNIN_25741 [Trichonephila inaurata madagascariensis]
MEPGGENNTTEGEEPEDKQHELKNQSRTSSSNEEKSENRSTVENMPENPPEVSENRPETSSPEPNCAICLEPLQNKSFLDSCLHTFCFTCLLEWSKVKPECPLCKKQFKSIVHNVQKDMTFEEYHVSSRTSKQLWTYFGRTEHRFRYPTTMTPSRIQERNRSSNQETYESQINSHRMRYAPHSVRRYSSSQMISRTPCPFRQRVYAENLWVQPPAKTRVRIATPEFFKCNPACTHRLLPWLSRELVSLWQNNEEHVTFVLELIMSLVARYSITSEEFLIHIEPYMGSNTHHFIHEFYNFAISPLDLENYDARANYNLKSSQNDQSSSSPDSDVIPIFHSIYSAFSHVPTGSNTRRIQKTSSNQLDKLVLKKKNEDSWESILEPITSAHFPSGSIYASPGPSTSRIGFSFSSPEEDMNINVTSDLDPTDDEEIQVVNVLRPKHERTPEVVELSSGEDEPKCMPVIDVSSGEEDFSQSDFPVNAYVSALYSHPGSDCSSSDVECVYDADRPSTSQDISDKEQPGPSVENNSKNHERTNLNVPFNEDFINSGTSNMRKSPKLASAIVRPWAMENESSHKPLSSELKRHLTSSYVDDSLTESCSDTGHSSERTAKKLKLRSVVAHFSIDTSDSRHDSGHRSSHKKHKDKKKKKKKKHMHRHKHRIYSESDSG